MPFFILQVNFIQVMTFVIGVSFTISKSKLSCLSYIFVEIVSLRIGMLKSKKGCVGSRSNNFVKLKFSGTNSVNPLFKVNIIDIE